MLFFYFKETLETNDSFIKSSHRRQECLRNWVKMREEALFSVKGIQLRHQGSYDTQKKKFLHKGQTFSKDISYY